MKHISLCALFLFLVSATQIRGQNLRSELSDITRIQHNVKSKRVSSYDTTGGNRDWVVIKKGEKQTIFEASTAGVIKHIWITMGPSPERLSRNDVIIRMYWDGNTVPSVESPIGPFFGQGWEESYEFTSLPLVAGPLKGRSLVSYFQMPFAKGARIEIENQNDRDITNFYYYIDYEEVKQLPPNTGRFHAWYNKKYVEAPPGGENEWELLGEPGKNKTGADNYLIADIKGKGHFIGVNYYVHSPSPVWYGEGDDMIFIDGSAMPTLHGTGTEDYFNTAWSPKTIYNHPYFGAGRVNDDNGWLGRTHVYRFHMTDPIHFDRSFRFSIEHGHNNVLTLDLASVAYWYQSEAVGVPAIPDKEVRKPKPFIDYRDIHRWRHEWRKNQGNQGDLWGNEKSKQTDL